MYRGTLGERQFLNGKNGSEICTTMSTLKFLRN